MYLCVIFCLQQLDAKKSPLALLAQTCSSIGKDPTPSKPIIPAISKKDNEKSHEKPTRESPDHKRPESNSNKPSGRDSSDKPGFRTVPSKDVVSPLAPISTSTPNSSPVRSETTKSPQLSRESKSRDNNSYSPANSPASRPGSRSLSVTSTSVTTTTSSRTGSAHRDHHDSTRDNGIYAMSMSSKHSRHSPEPSYFSKHGGSHPGLPGLPSSYPPSYQGFPLMPHGLPFEHSSLAAAQGLAANAAAMAAAQSQALKHAAAATQSAIMSPYVTYARVRTPSGATTLVPVCRDPYCSNCQLTLQTSHVSQTCNAPGCAQCAHEKSLQSLSTYGLPSAAGGLPFMPGAGGLLSASGLPGFPSMSSLYPQNALQSAHQVAPLTAHQGGLPFVCNWVSSGQDYCGKRFTTSEDLLQHLRSHTASADSSALAAAYGGLSSLAGFHGHLPSGLTNPGNLSPNSLRRSYPTSLSPGSMFSSSRYHPYKSPLTSTPSSGLPPPTAQQLQSLGQYYSPYALYGQRLGAAAVP